MFIYGSIAMLAALALPSKKAQAAEIYLCGDGRMIELNNSNRTTAGREDTCITSWYNERDKAVVSKSGKPAGQGVAAAKSSGYQIQTAAIEPLVNAVEVPEGTAMPKPSALREKLAGERRTQRAPARKSAAVNRAHKGLRYMGDGIYAE
jgi:hypothetical protein